jgi:acetyltransferase-like isoleucine patch superfamily enzyme
MGSTTILHESRENIHLADNVYIGHFNILDGSDVLSIGEGVQISHWVGLFTHSSHVSIRLQGDRYLEPVDPRPGWVSAPLSIGPYVFIGSKATVLPGCNVGRAAVVSAHSLVTKPVPDFAIVSGAPARIIGDVRERDAAHIDPTSEWWSTYRQALGLSPGPE